MQWVRQNSQKHPRASGKRDVHWLPVNFTSSWALEWWLLSPPPWQAFLPYKPCSSCTTHLCYVNLRGLATKWPKFKRMSLSYGMAKLTIKSHCTSGDTHDCWKLERQEGRDGCLLSFLLGNLVSMFLKLSSAFQNFFSVFIRNKEKGRMTRNVNIKV